MICSLPIVQRTGVLHKPMTAWIQVSYTNQSLRMEVFRMDDCTHGTKLVFQ